MADEYQDYLEAQRKAAREVADDHDRFDALANAAVETFLAHHPHGLDRHQLRVVLGYVLGQVIRTLAEEGGAGDGRSDR